MLGQGFEEIPVMHQPADFLPVSTRRVASLVELLRERANCTGERQVFNFLRASGEPGERLTYKALHERAMAIAAELQSLAEPDERALLLFPPGLDFIAAFFGCLYAGIVAVPAPIPSRNRSNSSAEAIFRASKPSLVLSTADHREQAKRTYAGEAGLLDCRWIAVDQIDVERKDSCTIAAWADGKRLFCNTLLVRPRCRAV